ncbi:hypothetical protein GW17_00006418 [Ensete ventricosum]|nr:hypothetical protein GW17_00006418 [Ensete ventricosum]
MASAAAAIAAALASLSLRPPSHRSSLLLLLKPLQCPPFLSSSVLHRTLPQLAATPDIDTSFFDNVDPKRRHSFRRPGSSGGICPPARLRRAAPLERVVQVRRVTKIVKGGKRLSFRVIVVVGDKKGQVGAGVGKAKETVDAIAKSSVNARRNIVSVPMTKYLTFPHR